MFCGPCRGSGGQLEVSSLLLPSESCSADQFQVTRLDSRYPHPLSHLAVTQ